jgi:YHS domain-containing protein
MCAMGLASGKDIQTDCSVNTQIQGKTYCFGSEEAMTQFMADPSGDPAKAQTSTQRSIPDKLGLLRTLKARQSSDRRAFPRPRPTCGWLRNYTR